MRRKFMVLILGVLIGLLAAGSALAAERAYQRPVKQPGN